MQDSVVDTGSAADRTGYSVSALTKFRVYGGGPRFVKGPGRNGRVVYRVTDLNEWIERRVISSTSEQVLT